MKKIFLPILALAIALDATTTAKAQVGAAMGLGRMMPKKAADKKQADNHDNTTSYQGREFPRQRTPADRLPKRGAEQLVALETQLERCHAAMLASPTDPISTPEQRAALQTALVNLAQAKVSRNLPDYQEEASFYLAEDARRQQAGTSAPATPTN
ncbi:MAG: hypothetical protein EOO36_07560 [Cytophagaceae bacterium]|nr:MAG: hypothetical protein EOO36_07560 [Cytophagaceae bacterium]